VDEEVAIEEEENRRRESEGDAEIEKGKNL